jgi:V/A-type H+-transporting ATPase subunit E
MGRMMGLEAVVQDIREKGRKNVETIRKETQTEVNEILKSAHQRVGELKTTAEQEVKAHIDHLMAQEDSAANLVVKRQLLNAQKEVLDQVYRVTLHAIADLPLSFHQKVLSALLHQAAKETGAGVISANERDFPVVKELIAQDKALSGFRMGGIVSIEGGILIENAESTMKIDLSYRTFLDKIWETGLKDAADVLFT